MKYTISIIDKDISEKDFRQCCGLLLKQMYAINSKSEIEAVNRGFKLGLNNSDTTKIFAVRTEDSEIVGIAYANKGTSITKAGYYLWINELHVQAKHRRKGIAKQLVNFIIDWCKMENIAGISLISDVDNEIAQGLYQQFGFEAEEVLIFDKVF